MSENPLQILHIARNPDTGVATAISSLVRAQRALGHDASILVLKSATWSPLRQLRELPIQSFWSPNVFGTAAFLYHGLRRGKEAWSRQVRDLHRPVIVHYHNAWLSGALMFNKPVPNVVQVVTYHGLASEAALYRQPLRRMIHAQWAQRTQQHADAVVSVDAATPGAAAQLFGVDEQSFLHIPNGTPKIDVSKEKAESLRRQSGRRLAVAHVGSIDEGKGWRLTAEAVDIANAKGASISLTLAGDGPFAREAQHWCQHRSDYCNYLGWVDDVPRDVLTLTDVLSMPSRSEGMPMAALEAISMGIPLVCTAVGGLPEVIRHEKEGFLIERNPEALADAFMKLASDAETRNTMSSNARERWNTHFTAEIMQARYEQLYARVLRDRSDLH